MAHTNSTYNQSLLTLPGISEMCQGQILTTEVFWNQTKNR